MSSKSLVERKLHISATGGMFYYNKVGTSMINHRVLTSLQDNLWLFFSFGIITEVKIETVDNIYYIYSIHNIHSVYIRGRDRKVGTQFLMLLN